MAPIPLKSVVSVSSEVSWLMTLIYTPTHRQVCTQGQGVLHQLYVELAMTVLGEGGIYYYKLQ